MKHRGFPDRTIYQVGLGAVFVIQGRNIDLDRTQRRLGQRAPNRAVDRLAANDQDLVDTENAPGGTNRMIEILSVYRPTSEARNSA